MFNSKKSIIISLVVLTIIYTGGSVVCLGYFLFPIYLPVAIFLMLRLMKQYNTNSFARILIVSVAGTFLMLIPSFIYVLLPNMISCPSL